MKLKDLAPYNPKDGLEDTNSQSEQLYIWVPFNAWGIYQAKLRKYKFIGGVRRILGQEVIFAKLPCPNSNKES